MNKEIRAFGATNITHSEEGVLVEGYAAVFGQDANIGGDFIERIERGAFTDAIGRDDVVFLANHGGMPLARTGSGTLILTEDDHGLKMSTRLHPQDPEALSIVCKMERGDMDSMSFAFLPEKGGDAWDDSGEMPVRTIRKARLFDVSIVNDGAYDGTSIALRSLEAFRASKPNNAATRLRMKGRIHGL